MLIAGVVFCIGVFMNMILNYFVMVAGTLTMAIGLGAITPTIQRWIQEYLPEKYIGPVFALTQIIVQVSVLTGTLSARFLPKEDDTEALEDD